MAGDPRSLYLLLARGWQEEAVGLQNGVDKVTDEGFQPSVGQAEKLEKAEVNNERRRCRVKLDIVPLILAGTVGGLSRISAIMLLISTAMNCIL